MPGAWRVEVSPASPAQEDHFLHVLEIGDKGSTGKRTVELLQGVAGQGAAVDQGPMVLFSSNGTPLESAEVSLPDLSCTSLMIAGLQPETNYELNLGGLNVSAVPGAVLPGVSVATQRHRSNENGILQLSGRGMRNLRLRRSRLSGS